jgi:hypothetical protein
LGAGFVARLAAAIGGARQGGGDQEGDAGLHGWVIGWASAWV